MPLAMKAKWLRKEPVCHTLVCSMQIYLGPQLEIVSSINTNSEKFFSRCHPRPSVSTPWWTAMWISGHWMLDFWSCTFGSLDRCFSLEVRLSETPFLLMLFVSLSRMFWILDIRLSTVKSSDWEVLSFPSHFQFHWVFCGNILCREYFVSWLRLVLVESKEGKHVKHVETKHVTSPGWIGWVSWWFRHTWWASEWSWQCLPCGHQLIAHELFGAMNP